MEETRKACIKAIEHYMHRIAVVYKTAYPDADYLSMAIFVKNGTMSVNNEYDDEDSDFPISERFDGKEWYDYMEGEKEQ